jgi:hypothetical protein
MRYMVADERNGSSIRNCLQARARTRAPCAAR